ncbi:MAG: insulinase family protein [Actinomycetota bacterium]|nr:insulinase family protein [Actinomycetota bacterium]
MRPAGLQKPGSTKTLSAGRYGGTIRRTVLPGGLRVITEALPTMRSVAFGIWVGIGSRDEVPSLGGSSHFLEHLLFKGTKKRSALDISAAMDAVGGEMNAFTAKEYTCYYARVLDVDMPLAVDIISDMVASSVITGDDLEVERGVILEEIAMHDDDPGDVVHDVFSEAVFGGHPLGRPVIGTVESIKGMRREQVSGFYRRRYQAPVMVVAAAGNLEHAHVVRLVRRAMRDTPLLADESAAPAEPRSAHRRVPASPAKACVVDRQTEQAHVVLGGRGIARHDDRRFALGVLNNAFGGGMSSRLFQEIREKRGLAYSVYSYSSQHADAGVFGVYAGCAPGNAERVLTLIREQLDAVASTGLTDSEVERGRGQLKGSLVLGLEDSCSRMSRIGKGELVYGDILEVDDLISRIDAVTPDDVRVLAADLLGQPLSLGAIGPFGDRDLSAAVAT